jgi:hypothetical protein
MGCVARYQSSSHPRPSPRNAKYVHKRHFAPERIFDHIYDGVAIVVVWVSAVSGRLPPVRCRPCMFPGMRCVISKLGASAALAQKREIRPQTALRIFDHIYDGVAIVVVWVSAVSGRLPPVRCRPCMFPGMRCVLSNSGFGGSSRLTVNHV